MVKNLMSLLLVLLVAVPLSSAPKNWTAVETKNYPAVDPDNLVLPLDLKPSGPIVTASPGDTVGTTWYDYQHNGTISKMITNEGCDVQYVWMNGLNFQATNRHVFYNYGDPPTDKIGVQIDPGSISRSGYITLDVLSDGRAVPGYHAKLPQWTGPNDLASAVSLDLLGCLGAFSIEWVDTITLPPIDPLTAMWPHVAVDNLDYIHVVAHQAAPDIGDPAPVWYSRSVIPASDTFNTWVQIEDSLYTISYDIQTSRLSGRVAIAYCHAVPWDSTQVNEDLWYMESTDNGATWGPQINVTNFTPSDTLRAYTDVSVLYDNNDSLHLAFSARYVVGDTIFYYASAIMHWSKKTGLTVINSDTAIGWHSLYSAGGWRMMADRPSLGIDPATGFLYCVFVGNPLGDTSDITSNGGWPNGELFAASSCDTGRTWGAAVNLTNTPSPDCIPGTCEDDDYPSLAEIVDDNLHILYINDKHAGGVVQTNPQEGTWTLNPVLYLKVPKGNVLCRVGIEEGKDRATTPHSFSLAQNIPNPFGSTTTFSFSLPVKADATLRIYDITGREINTLVNEFKESGVYRVEWDGRNVTGERVPSGIYFYRLQISHSPFNKGGKGDFTQTRKMVVLR